MTRKLIFRLSPQKASSSDSGVQIIFGVYPALRYLPYLLARFGPVGVIKLLINIMIGRTAYYCLKRDCRIVSDGLISLGHCRAYAVSRNDAVIGSIYTDPEFRRAGHATTALKALLHGPFCAQFDYVYIDVHENNHGSRKVIERAGFGPVYLKIEVD